MIKLLSHLSYVEITSPGCRGVRRSSTRSRSGYASSTAWTAPCTCAAGATTTLQRRGRARRRAVARHDGLAHLERRGARRGRSTRIEAAGIPASGSTMRRTSAARTASPARGATMTLHWDVDASPGPRATSRRSTPTARSSAARSPAPRASSTTSRSPRSDVEAFVAVVQRRARLPHHGPYRARRGPDLGVLRADHQREVARPRRRPRRLDHAPGRINHYAFWVDTREELLIAADILMENGIPIEYGPSIHGIGEQNFLYFREPSTLRIELNTGGYRNYVPDWEPNTWKPSQGSNNFYRNGAMPMSMTESFPPPTARAPPRRACPTRSRTRCSTRTPCTAGADHDGSERRSC